MSDTPTPASAERGTAENPVEIKSTDRPTITTKVTVKKLGATAIDLATNRKVMVTHMSVDSGGHITYFAQPQGLNNDGRPIRPFQVSASRIPGAEEETLNLPLGVIGTEVEDIASGYKGTATGLFYHLTGCAHVVVQSPYTDSKGNPVEAQEFDLRRCKGPAIPSLSEEEIVEDQKVRPSPNGVRAPVC